MADLLGKVTGGKSEEKKDEKGGDEKKDEKGGDEKKGGEKKDEVVEKVKIKQGDYCVQVHVIECRDLPGRGMGDMSDPVAVVEVMDKKQQTKIHKKCLNVVFDEVLVFEFKDVFPAQLERGKCTIAIYDANTIRRDVMIGLYQYDLATIYYKKHHELFRQWAALTDITDEHEGIQGYLKASITVLGPDDEQYIHSAADNDDEDESMLGVLMPPQLEQKGYLMRVNCIRVEDLPVMDIVLTIGSTQNRGCDPYVRIDFGGMTVKTPHKEGLTVDLLQEVQVPVMEPVLSRMVTMSMYDHDAGGGDDRICTWTFDYVDTKESKDSKVPVRWYNMYGAPVGKQSGWGSKMNKGYIEGSYYRGRILMGRSVEPCEEPKKEVVNCSHQAPPPEEQYVVQFDLYEGSEITTKQGKMHVEIHIGPHITKSEPVQAREGRCQWYAVLKDLAIPYPIDVSQVPDVFVYLCSKKKRLSYLRFSMEDLMKKGWKVPPAWNILKECLALDALENEEFPGSLLFSLRAGLLKDAPQEPFPESRPLKAGGQFIADLESAADDAPSSSLETKTKTPDNKTTSGPTKTPDDGKVSRVGTLRIDVMEGISLPAMDSGGTSDPYVVVSIGSVKFKTKVIKKNLAPKWNESFEFRDINIASNIVFKVFDHDLMSDDQMGEATVDLRTQQKLAKAPLGKDFVVESTTLISDKYPNAQLKIRYAFSYVAAGLSEQLEKKQHEEDVKKSKSFFGKIARNKTPATIAGADSPLGRPAETQYQLRVHLYQARNLPATDNNGLADPYVIVKCCGKSLRFVTRKETLNPTWYTTMATTVSLPEPLALAPHIQIFVFDWDAIGKDDPIGRLCLPCTEALKMNPDPAKVEPRWFALTDFENKALEGSRILMSFQLLSSDQITLLSPDFPNIKPETVPMVLEVTTLGLRNLTSTLGVHKTYIEFELPNGKRFRTEKSREPSPACPNFLQVLKIPIDLPVQRIFAPSLDFEVRDTLFGGLIKRLIGSSSLEMEQFMQEDEKVPGMWKPCNPQISIVSNDEIAREIKEAEFKKKMEEEGAKQAERKAKADANKSEEDKEKEKDSKDTKGGDTKDGKEDPNAPLLGVNEKQSDHDPKKDDGVGIGKMPDEKSGLLDDEKVDVKSEFKEKKQDKYDPATEKPEPDDPEDDIPPYMKGRVVVDDELEDFMTIEPFHTLTLHTGQKNAGPFGDKWREVGIFKGLIRLCESKEEEPALDMKDLLQPQELYLRLYILRGYSLTPKDDDGLSDPYIILKMNGKKPITTRDRYIRNSLNPEFFESFEIPVTVPGDATVTIVIMDWDGIGDDLIGTTTVDIEDRWFCKEWRKLDLKPVERRTLKSPSSNYSQGKLELWVEILDPQVAKREPMINIKPPPPIPFEIRVIIWGTKEVSIKDTLTQQNDLFVTCHCSFPGLGPAEKQSTDIHFRSKKGVGNFNWRMKYPISLPTKTWPRLRFQIWDFDIFSPNDSICEAVLTLKGLCKRALKKKDRVQIIMKGKDRFWLDQLRHPNFKGNQGRMEISIEIIPQEQASTIPAGLGRSDPNTNPFLPPPEGRMNFSLFHPLDMLKDILGPSLYRKLCIGCGLTLCAAMCIYMLPQIASNVIASTIMSI